MKSSPRPGAPLMPARVGLALSLTAALIAAALAPAPSSAKAGDLDRSFGRDGKVVRESLTSARDVTVDSRGRTLTLSSLPGERRGPLVISRFRPNGRLDKSFSNDGSVRIDAVGNHDYAAGIGLTGGGRIIVATDTGSSSRYDPCDGGESYVGEVYRLLPRGKVDKKFGDHGKTFIRFRGGGSQASSSPTSLAIAPDGSIVLAGYAYVDPRNDCPKVAAATRLTPDGDLDESFGVDGSILLDPAYEASDVEVDRDGRALIAASLSRNRLGITRLDSSGEIDTTYGDGGTASQQGGYAVGLELLANGGAVLDGGFNRGRTGALIFDGEGAIEPEVGDAGFVELPFKYGYELPLVAKGSGFLAAGTLGSRRENKDAGLVRVGADGTIDEDFGRGGLARVDVGDDSDDEPASLGLSSGSIVTVGGGIYRGAHTTMALLRFKLR